MRLFSALRYRPFALLWLGRTVSSLGDGVFLVAVAWWVLETTRSASANGLILICETLPLLLLLLVGGAVVDRMPRRRLLLLSDGVRGLVVCSVALLAWQHMLAVWHLAILSIIFGAVRAFFFPAYTSILPQVMPKEALPSANSLASLSRQASGIVGPALGGVLIALGGTPIAFGLDGVSFFLSAACIVAMPFAASTSEAHAERAGVLHDVRDGLLIVLRSPWLWITIAVAGVSNITLSGPLEAALPLLVSRSLHANVGVYSLLNTLSALGAALAAVAVGQAAKLRRRGVVTYGAWLVAGVALSFMGLPIGVVGVGVAILVCGAAFATLELVWANTLQEMVSPTQLGRVSSIDALGSYGLLPVGYGLAGLAADHIGPAPTFVVGGAISVIVIALGLLHPGVRKLD
ncbi:MAG: MFS transporter [Ktedonobacterales bacterium]